MNADSWVLEEAVELIKMIEKVCPDCGCHVALTGGLLYKEGPRKDLDILFYRIRQNKEIKRDRLLTILGELGIIIHGRFGWLNKASYLGKTVDLFFPEYVDGPADAKGHYR